MTTLIVEADVRYWEDAKVNGVEDSDGTLIPLRAKDSWCPMIDLASGKVIDWPEGTTADIHYKVCDAGQYWLGNEQGVKFKKWSGCYVPDRLLCVGDEGYGDYIILTIESTGQIRGWIKPTINPEDWV